MLLVQSSEQATMPFVPGSPLDDTQIDWSLWTRGGRLNWGLALFFLLGLACAGVGAWWVATSWKAVWQAQHATALHQRHHHHHKGCRAAALKAPLLDLQGERACMCDHPDCSWAAGGPLLTGKSNS